MMMKILLLTWVLCSVAVRAEIPSEVHSRPIRQIHPLDSIFNKLTRDVSTFFDNIFGKAADPVKESRQLEPAIASKKHKFVESKNGFGYTFVANNRSNILLPGEVVPNKIQPKSLERKAIDNGNLADVEAIDFGKMCYYADYHRLSWSNQIFGLDYKLQLVAISGLTIFFVFIISFLIHLVTFFLHACKKKKPVNLITPDAKFVDGLPTYSEACAVVNPNHIVHV